MEHQHKYIRSVFRILSAIAVPFSLCLLFYSTVGAQHAENHQDEIYHKSFARAVSIYDASIGKNSMLFTGSSYYSPYDGLKGHQYFIDDYWERGSITYQGQVFDSIFLKYDIFSDLLLIEHFNINGYPSPIIVYRPKVNSFTLMEHYFIWIEKDTISNLRAGFYNQMYKSKDLEVMVKRRKEIVNSNEINTIREEFVIKDRYYIKKTGMVYRVNKKRSILKVLADRKKEVKSFIKKNNYQFRYNPDNQLVEVVKYYDSLL